MVTRTSESEEWTEAEADKGFVKRFISVEEANKLADQGVQVYAEWGVEFEDGYMEDVFLGYYILIGDEV